MRVVSYTQSLEILWNSLLIFIKKKEKIVERNQEKIVGCMVKKTLTHLSVQEKTQFMSQINKELEDRVLIMNNTL